MSAGINPVIFCDFDGTITMKDNIVNIMDKFAPPGWEEIKDDIMAQKVSIQQGVSELFALLPTSQKEQIVSFVLEDAEIREGFGEFVQFTREQNIPLYIVSGGIDFFIHPLLESFGPFDQVYCNESDFSGEHISILFPHACDASCVNQGCGCCKPTIIRQLTAEQQTSIVIGDSITDLEAAKLADSVIARDFLIGKCEELNIPYSPFTNFHDCIRIIEARLNVQV